MKLVNLFCCACPPLLIGEMKLLGDEGAVASLNKLLFSKLILVGGMWVRQPNFRNYSVVANVFNIRPFILPNSVASFPHWMT
jgi:hypothetical protein